VKLRVRIRPPGPDLQLILAADDRLQLAIERRAADRATGGHAAAAGDAWWKDVASLPASMTKDQRAAAILDKPLPS